MTDTGLVWAYWSVLVWAILVWSVLVHSGVFEQEVSPVGVQDFAECQLTAHPQVGLMFMEV